MHASEKSILSIHHAGLQRGTSKREEVLDSIITLHQADDYDAPRTTTESHRQNTQYPKI